jgi:hypothetical protein
MAKKYKLDIATSDENFENMIFKPTDGAEYSFSDAISKLETGYGGTMMETKTNKSAIVNAGARNPKNDWIYPHFKEKKNG